MLKIAKSVWELPQNVLGYIILKVTRAKHYRGFVHGGKITDVHSWKYNSGLSLGRYIFVPYKVETPLSKDVMEYIRHEHGHSLQSQKLGWAYLVVIGLPSIIWAGCFEGYRRKHNISYYSFYTERWADKLGGVERKDNNG